jgi:septal ring-binding cell division protein DamX
METRDSGKTIIPAQPVHRPETSVQISAQTAADYEKIHESFLREDYAAVDRLAGQYLSGGRRGANAEDVLYLQALALLKLNRADEARQKLRELENLFASSDRKASASASIGDSYYYAGDFGRASQAYEETLRKYPASDQAEYIQSQLGAIRAKSPASFYTVQVGSFSNQKNARALAGKLSRLNYDAYVEKDENGRMYRVRVGHFTSKEEAFHLETRLKREGYPTKIYP